MVCIILFSKYHIFSTVIEIKNKILFLNIFLIITVLTGSNFLHHCEEHSVSHEVTHTKKLCYACLLSTSLKSSHINETNLLLNNTSFEKINDIYSESELLLFIDFPSGRSPPKN